MSDRFQEGPESVGGWGICIVDTENEAEPVRLWCREESFEFVLAALNAADRREKLCAV